MSENVSHLFESDSAPDHTRCRCVPESMCAEPADRNPSEFEMPFRDAANSTAEQQFHAVARMSAEKGAAAFNRGASEYRAAV